MKTVIMAGASSTEKADAATTPLSEHCRESGYLR